MRKIFLTLLPLLFLCVVLHAEEHKTLGTKPILEKTRDRATVKIGGKQILSVKLFRKGGKPNYRDAAVLVGGCLVVARDINNGENGDSDLPMAKKMDIFPVKGGHKVYNKDVFFYGNGYSSPLETWGVILYWGACNTEGDLCGYHFIKSDGSLKEYSLNEPVMIVDASTHTASEDELSISNVKRYKPGMKVYDGKLVVKKDGTHIID